MNLKILAGIAFTALVALSALAFGLLGQQAAPTPSHISVKQYFDTLQAEHKANQTRLNSRTGKPSPPLGGTISRIDGASIQFHMDYRFLRKDHYLTCTFPTADDVLPLNVGQYVVIVGVLEAAFPHDVPLFGEVGAVKLKDCQSPSTGSLSRSGWVPIAGRTEPA